MILSSSGFMQVIPASIASFLISCTMLLALRPFAVVVGLVDRPGGRKTHHGDVPVVGGLAMFAGLLVAAVGGDGLGHGGLNVLVVSLFMVVLGALDDRFNLPPKVRLFAHLSAAVALVYSSGHVVRSLGDLVGWGDIGLGMLSLPFTVVSIVALINAFNMLDGLDGLAGSAGLVALCGIMTLSSLGGSGGTLLIAGSMLGAVAAFLMFNLPTRLNRPIRTFMGDAGSTLLGFVLAGLSLSMVQPTTGGLSPVVVLWLMPIPVFELFTSTTRRLVRGMSPTQADSGHFHHLFIAAGMSVRAICTLYFLVSASSCAFGVWAHMNDVPASVLFVGFCAAFGLWLMLVRGARRFVAGLPQWFRRVDASAGH
jgi:UDP-GlcNAc:undecaprenyl-phosphate/decaprenyl-phosphate GlcNAc-1-phosphate transferase